MEALSKRHLRRKLAGHPFLCLLLQDAWFRAGIGGIFILLIALALSLPPIWTSSPPGFRPVVKISGLDRAQAWSLKRAALNAMTAERFEDAGYAWKAALAQNPADADLVRGLLKNVLASGIQPTRGRGAVSHGFWLLKLTGTNLADLELVGRVLDRAGHHDLFIGLIDSKREKAALPLALETLYLKALFNDGRVAAFGKRWQQVREKFPADDVISLYRWAFDAGWGDGEARTNGWRSLQSGLEDRRHQVTAARLLLPVSLERRDANQYSQALQRLREWHSETFLDELGFWRLLAWEGRKDEAVRLAEFPSSRPSSANEAIALALLYREWSLREQALRVFRDFSRAFNRSSEFWVAYAQELIDARGWEELHQLAFKVRLQPEVHDELIGFSYYLEGRAELGRQRHFHAEAAFARICQWEFPHPRLGLTIAEDLLLLGYVKIARSLLLQIERPLALSPDYWSLLFRAAEKLNDADLMLRAAQMAFQLRPADAASASNYAATLLIHRQSPEEAVRLTLSVLSRRPGSLSARINHAAALLLNNRAEEAMALLGSVNPKALPETQRSLYYLDVLQACLSLQRFDEAWAASDFIEPRDLYPPQIRWMEDAQKRLPPRYSAE